MNTLYYNTISELLLDSLKTLMNEPALNQFRLVGGTSLSLQLGHRKSIDIDLFTDILYGTMDTEKIANALQRTFNYVDGLEGLKDRAPGYSLICGDSPDKAIKLDLFYTNDFIFPPTIIDNIRMASIEEIAAMKMLAIVTGERKKDYWDIHELLEHFSLENMIEWGINRHPYEISRDEILNKLANASNIDDSTPIYCLRGKYWEFVAEDLEEAANTAIKNN